ncbi:MAG: cell division protein FtsQ/DivIB [Gammaproteobacteria bacterium]
MRRPARNRPLRNRLIRTELRAERRPWGFRLVATFMVVDLSVLLGFAGAWLSDPETLPIREVFIEGEFRQLKPSELEALVARQVYGGFFTVRVADVQHGLRRDPWVKAASVSREWPDGLRVTVYEERAVARFGERGLLSPEGVLFSPPAASYPAGLPLLDGPKGTEAQVLMRYHHLAELLDQAGLRAQGLAQDARGSWRFVLRDGPLVLVGREDFERRVKRFVAHYRRIVQSGRGVVARVDLRHTNGIAVSFKPEAVPAAHRPLPSSSLRGVAGEKA